ncbi:hypothetical protein TSUD_296810 [Trifolium subterraneum]|uniref:Reverse transcriptase zinc-binding domain-containing protein n=1 Tax=Trifolium subterraneum TaxID=3900 RepID=A0A2Z6PC93_TRISU|nr:hypothetical protein TSUD_296810 [Trifolium subterraneum]
MILGLVLLGMMVNTRLRRGIASLAKISFRSWRQRLPARDNLSRRGVPGLMKNSSCVWCPEERETEMHLFGSCRVALEVWAEIYKWIGIQSVHSSDLCSSFESFGFPFNICKKRRKGLCLIWHTVIWSLWKARNACIFDGKELSIHHLVETNKHVSLKWLIARDLSKQPPPRRHVTLSEETKAGKSFRAALVGGPVGGAAGVKSTVLKVPINESLCKELQSSVVGILRREKDVGRIQTTLFIEGFSSVLVTHMGGNMALLRSSVEGDVDRMLRRKKETLEYYFRELKPWNPGLFATNREV